MEKAWYLATHGRPGPVWVDIPLDIQAQMIDPATLAPFHPPDENDGAAFDPVNSVASVIERLNRAERPLLLAGNGIRLSRAEKEFRELIELLDIPVETTWLAVDLIEHDFPFYVGRPGVLASRGANFAIQNCDFLLSLGARLDRVVTGYAPERFARSAYKVMVDIDPAELKKMGNTIHAPINADAGIFIREMLRQRNSIRRMDRGHWNGRCADWKTRYPLVLPEHKISQGRVSVYNFSQVLSQELSEGDYIVSGSSGSAIELFQLAFEVKRGQRIFHTAALGAMGFGLPASIGACVASGRRSTVCVNGDGGFQFNIQELETVARLQLPIKFFILNNDGYASIRASQTAFFGSPRIGCDLATGQSLPDIRRVAAAYGLGTDLISDQSNLREEVRRVLRQPGPVVCDVQVIPDEVRQPRLSSVQKADGSFESKPLEDLWPYLDRDEFESNMLIPSLKD
jgi:acetolactate synthase-1/2/3 large subunit